MLDERGPLVQRELARELHFTPRHVTTLVDALEASGLVARSPHPSDRRATVVSLTRRGKAATARMRTERDTAAAALLAGSTSDELAGFVATAERLLERLERQAGAESAFGR